MGIQYLFRAISSRDDNELFAVLDEYDQLLESTHSASEVATPEIVITLV